MQLNMVKQTSTFQQYKIQMHIVDGIPYSHRVLFQKFQLMGDELNMHTLINQSLLYQSKIQVLVNLRQKNLKYI